MHYKQIYIHAEMYIIMNSVQVCRRIFYVSETTPHQSLVKPAAGSVSAKAAGADRSAVLSKGRSFLPRAMAKPSAQNARLERGVLARYHWLEWLDLLPEAAESATRK